MLSVIKLKTGDIFKKNFQKHFLCLNVIKSMSEQFNGVIDWR